MKNGKWTIVEGKNVLKYQIKENNYPNLFKYIVLESGRGEKCEKCDAGFIKITESTSTRTLPFSNSVGT